MNLLINEKTQLRCIEVIDLEVIMLHEKMFLYFNLVEDILLVSSQKTRNLDMSRVKEFCLGYSSPSGGWPLGNILESIERNKRCRTTVETTVDRKEATLLPGRCTTAVDFPDDNILKFPPFALSIRQNL